MTDRACEVQLEAGEVSLPGTLLLPDRMRGLVIFAHGSGSSRRSPRNRYVAEGLSRDCLASLLFDLLTAEEERVDARSRALRFNIGMLGRRLGAVIDWADGSPALREQPIGLFGASTGAAAALVAAAERPQRVGAVVSRGGRPDLAAAALPRVRAPSLFIVGAADDVVIELNRAAAEALAVEHRLELVAGATHLFEEPGALEEVTRLASQWFLAHLGA